MVELGWVEEQRVQGDIGPFHYKCDDGPVEDYAAPRVEALVDVIARVIAYAETGRNVVVHCSAGQGRTGTFMACMARQFFGLSGEEAIAWARRYIPGAVETPGQE